MIQSDALLPWALLLHVRHEKMKVLEVGHRSLEQEEAFDHDPIA